MGVSFPFLPFLRVTSHAAPVPAPGSALQELLRFPLIHILDRVLLRLSVPWLPLAKAARRGKARVSGSQWVEGG